VADALRVDVGERAEELVDVELDFEDRHDRLHLVEVARSPVDGFGDEFEDQVEVDFVLLWLKRLVARTPRGRILVDTYPLAIVIEEGLELDNIGMPDDAHDLQFTVLLRVSCCAIAFSGRRCKPTLKRLSCSTRLMAASSPLGESLVWNTTPKEPLPTILHCVYARSLYSPVWPSWTFSRMTSTSASVCGRRGEQAGTYRPF
jgi:hypothetical protein